MHRRSDRELERSLSPYSGNIILSKVNFNLGNRTDARIYLVTREISVLSTIDALYQGESDVDNSILELGHQESRRFLVNSLQKLPKLTPKIVETGG